YGPLLTSSEMATLRTVTDMLYPFSLATKEMGAYKVTTASKVIPMVHLITRKLNGMRIVATDNTARALHKFLLSALDRRFKDIEFHMPLAIASMMDPRFLKIYFEKPIAVANTLTKMEEFGKNELRNKAREDERVAEETAAASTAPQTATEGTPNLRDTHDALISSSYAAGVTDDLAGRARTELRAFLARPPAPRDANPLKVWNTIKHEYPHVYKLAIKFLPIVATSVPSERLFSLTGRIFDDDGNRLSPIHLSQRVFLSKVDEELWVSVL
ncbi:Zinc finger BED domain-containing protein 4, partial [Frankliniella fusca]